MEVFQCTDSSTIAHLNKDVHDLHYALYPEYFKAYNDEEVNQFFQKLMADKTSNHYFYLLCGRGRALGYIWFEKNSTKRVFLRYQLNRFMFIS